MKLIVSFLSGLFATAAATLTTTTQPTERDDDDDDMCQLLRERLAPGDSERPDSYCNSDGICEDLYWETDEHEGLAELSWGRDSDGHYTEPIVTERLEPNAVTCSDASDWLEENRPNKRNRSDYDEDDDDNLFHDILIELIAGLKGRPHTIIADVRIFPLELPFEPSTEFVTDLAERVSVIQAAIPTEVPDWVTVADREVMTKWRIAMRSLLAVCVNSRHLPIAQVEFANPVVELFTLIHPLFTPQEERAALDQTLAVAKLRLAGFERNPEWYPTDRIPYDGPLAMRDGEGVPLNFTAGLSANEAWTVEVGRSIGEAQDRLPTDSEWAASSVDEVCSSLVPKLDSFPLLGLITVGNLCGVNRIPPEVRVGRFLPALIHQYVGVPLPVFQLKLTGRIAAPQSLRASFNHLVDRVSHASNPNWRDLEVTAEGITKRGGSPDDDDSILAEWITLQLEAPAAGLGQFRRTPGGHSVTRIMPSSNEEMAVIGRLVGIALRRGIRVYLPVSSGFLFSMMRPCDYFDATGPGITSIDRATLIDWANEHSPEAVTALLPVLNSAPRKWSDKSFAERRAETELLNLAYLDQRQSSGP